MFDVAKKLTTGLRVRRWREVRGLSIRDLAHKAKLHRSSVHRIETDQQHARDDDMQSLTKALRLTMAEFFDDDALVAAQKALEIGGASS